MVYLNKMFYIYLCLFDLEKPIYIYIIHLIPLHFTKL